MDEDWRNAFGNLMCTKICNGAGAGICNGAPSTCTRFVYSRSFLSLFFPINKVSLGITKCPGLRYGTSAQLASITKTYLYNFDPFKPHFYIVKLGFTGVNIIFLISAQNIDCGYSLEPPHRGGSNEYLQSMF